MNKVAITIDLDKLKSLMGEFVLERGGDEDLLRRLTLSDFLLWLRMKENNRVEETTPSLTSAEADRTIG